MAGPRTTLAGLLAPLLPSTWKIVRTVESLDKFTKPLVAINQTRIEKNVAAPAGAHEIFFVVTILSPLENRTRAEDQLDTTVNILCHAIEESPSILWTSAEKVVVNEKYLAYELNVQLVSKKE